MNTLNIIKKVFWSLKTVFANYLHSKSLRS
jgi:hypothetical protein